MIKTNFALKIVLAFVFILALILGAFIVYSVYFVPSPKLPESPAPTIINYEDSPFGFVPSAIDGNFSASRDIGVQWGSIGFAWGVAQPDLKTNAFHFKKRTEKGRVVLEDDILPINSVSYVYAGFEHDQPISNNDDGRFYPSNNSALPTSWKPRDPEKLAQFIRKTVERYDGDSDYGCVVFAPDCYVVGDDEYPSPKAIEAITKSPIKYWVIGNEPALIFSRYPNFEAHYEEYAEVAIPAIKSACADCKVLNGGFPGDPEGYLSTYVDRYLPVLARMGNTHFDIIDVHWYGTANGDYRFIDPKSNTDVLDYIRGKFVEMGYPENMPIWITEMSSYSGAIFGGRDPSSPYQSESQQAGDYLKRYVYSLSRNVQKIFTMFGLIEGFVYDDDYFDHTGLVYDGQGSSDLGYGVKKIGYYSYKLMTQKLEGSDWSNVSEVYSQNNVYVYKFINKQNQKLTYIAWWDYWTEPNTKTKQVTIPVSLLSGKVKITEAIPAYENGLLLQQSGTTYPNFFNKGGTTVTNGQVTITLGQSPVYIEQTTENLGGYIPHAWLATTPNAVNTTKPAEVTKNPGTNDCTRAGGTICSKNQSCSAGGKQTAEGLCCLGLCVL